MHSRIARFMVALVFAALAAGVTLLVVQAQDGGPGTATSPTAQTPKCVACHTEFATEWEKGPHGQANTDAVFVQQWTQQGKPGACLVCHTTNYDPATGTWQEDGVACEACHGPMTPDHPKSAMPVTLSPDLCARCHSADRFGWQNWHESAHYQRGMNCTTCHDPHSASLKMTRDLTGKGYNDASQLCVNCHKDVSMNFPYSVHQKQGVTCINCHVTHTEQSLDDAHTVPDHSFKANLDSCNTCHADQMHSAAGTSGQTTQSTGVVSADVQPVQQAGLSPAPSPVSPIGYAGLAALMGLAAGMIMAPWLEKWYRRATTRVRGGNDE